jgi:hypothetical protein
MGTIPHLHLAGRAGPSKVETSTAWRGSLPRPMRGQQQTSTSAPRRRYRNGSPENAPPREGRYCLSTQPNEATFWPAASTSAWWISSEASRAHALIWSRRAGGLIGPSQRRPAHPSGASSGVRWPSLEAASITAGRAMTPA